MIEATVKRVYGATYADEESFEIRKGSSSGTLLLSAHGLTYDISFYQII